MIQLQFLISILHIGTIVNSSPSKNFGFHQNDPAVDSIKQWRDAKFNSHIKESNQKTLQTSLFAVVGGGGLGNILFELMSLRGSADYLNRTAVINAANGQLMNMLFTKIQPVFPAFLEEFDLKLIPDYQIRSQYCNFGACCKYDDPFKYFHLTEQHLLLNGHYFQSFKYFSHLRSSIQQWLTPDKLSFARARMMLPPENYNDFLVCAHIRRGDFQDDGVHQPSHEAFTRAGVEFLVKKYQNKMSRRKVNVAILGNDVVWTKSVFHDKTAQSRILSDSMFNFQAFSPYSSAQYEVILTPSLAPVVDIAFSRSFCDVFLITAPSSTFGWWLAYLSKPGSNVYYRDIGESTDKVAREMREADFYPPEWTKLMTNALGNIEIVGGV